MYIASPAPSFSPALGPRGGVNSSSQLQLEPLASVDMKDSQSALLLALASAKCIGDLHAFSVDSDCIHFGPGDCAVTLWPRITCLKSPSTPFRTQTVSLSALSSESSTSRDANAQISVCPVRALRIYIDRSASFRQSHQLSCVLRWLCEGPYQNRGFPLDCGHYHGCIYEPRFGMPFSH